MNIRTVFAKPRQLPFPLASVTPRPAPAPAVHREAVPPNAVLCYPETGGIWMKHEWSPVKPYACKRCGRT